MEQVRSHVRSPIGRSRSRVEIDPSLSPVLDESLAGLNNVEVIMDDVTKWTDAELDDLTAATTRSSQICRITSPRRCCSLSSNAKTNRRPLPLCTKEVAERICATRKRRLRRALVAVALRGKASITRIVKRDCFTPAPNVDSAVIRIDLDPAAPTDRSLYELVAKSFAMKRKTLVNNLSAGYAIPKPFAAELLVSSAFPHRPSRTTCAKRFYKAR
ncbi:MAG: rRNA adenine N-6-methyltransferase family protein [Christensenellales bacterium]